MLLIGTNGRYIGDGVYASTDGYQIWLQTDQGEKIALDPAVMDALETYNREMKLIHAPEY